MQQVEDTRRPYEVERRSHYAARPGFRIAEMQISPTQTIQKCDSYIKTPLNSGDSTRSSTP
jgi:hypothetical protein